MSQRPEEENREQPSLSLRRIIGGIDNSLDSQVKIVQVLRSGLELASGEKI